MSIKPKLNFLHQPNNRIVFLFLIATYFIGLYYSKVVLSVFPYLILLYGLAMPKVKSRLISFGSNKGFISISLILLIYLISGINSTDILQWIQRVNTNLLYLIIPLGIYLNKEIIHEIIDEVLVLFVLANLVISTYLFGDYMMHQEIINTSYLSGKTLSTPIIHVRYSYFVAMSILFSSYLYLTDYQYKRFLNKYVFAVIGLLLLVFIHVLAVRTGIISIYITVMVMALYYILKHRKYTIGVTAIVLIIVIAGLSYTYLPSIKNKINYISWDITSTIDHTATHHTSDRIRINSIINGIKIFREHPFFGVGIGDLEAEMNTKYNANYPDLPLNLRFNPINQFVFILAAMGGMGFLLFFGLLITPLFLSGPKHLLLLPFYILSFSTFIGETTIELFIGKSAFLFILAVLLTPRNKNIKNS